MHTRQHTYIRNKKLKLAVVEALGTLSLLLLLLRHHSLRTHILAAPRQAIGRLQAVDAAVVDGDASRVKKGFS